MKHAAAHPDTLPMKRPRIEVFPIGSKVWIGEDEDRISGTVLWVKLVHREHIVVYGVEWWDGRKNVSSDFQHWQVRLRDETQLEAIGFK